MINFGMKYMFGNDFFLVEPTELVLIPQLKVILTSFIENISNFFV